MFSWKDGRLKIARRGFTVLLFSVTHSSKTRKQKAVFSHHEESYQVKCDIVTDNNPPPSPLHLALNVFCTYELH